MSGTAGPGRRRLAIAVPTYNEAANVGPLLDALDGELAGLADVDATVLVIDDASPDGTAALVESLADRYRHLRVEVLRRPGKRGLGAAYADGLARLLARPEIDLVLTMDADLSHDPRHIPAMLDAARHAQVVVGSRYVPGGSTADWAWYRRLVSRLGNLYAQAWLGSTITDSTGGFNLFDAGLLRRVGVETMTADGYGFGLELKHTAASTARGVAQVPITFVDRRQGQSKIPRNTIWRNLVLVPALRGRLRAAGSGPRPRPAPGGAERRSPSAAQGGDRAGS
ncbi:MAG TPA: polyprenol monophosphomannose synthase [Acidimicrobiales bacterium]|nr:polyprenol monophosphomannose synthase [Acidimicrobiales bacterium]